MKNFLTIFAFTVLVSNFANGNTPPAPAATPVVHAPPPTGATVSSSSNIYKAQGTAIDKMAGIIGECKKAGRIAELESSPGRLTHDVKEGMWASMYDIHSTKSEEPFMDEATAKDLLTRRLDQRDSEGKLITYDKLNPELKKAVDNYAIVFVRNFKSLKDNPEAWTHEPDVIEQDKKGDRNGYKAYLAQIPGVMASDKDDARLMQEAETALIGWLKTCRKNEQSDDFKNALGEAAKVAETEIKAKSDFDEKMKDSSLARRAAGDQEDKGNKAAADKLKKIEGLHSEYQKAVNDSKATEQSKKEAAEKYKKGLEKIKETSSKDVKTDIDVLLGEFAAAPAATTAAVEVSAEVKKQNELAKKLLSDQEVDGATLSPSGSYLAGNPREGSPVLLKDPNLYTKEDLVRLQEEKDVLTKEQGEAAANEKKILADLTKIVADPSSSEKSIADKRKELEEATALTRQVSGLLKRTESQELRYNLTKSDDVAKDVATYMKDNGIKGSSLSSVERVKIEADFAEKQLLESRQDETNIKKAESDAAELLSQSAPTAENQAKAAAARSAYLHAGAQLKKAQDASARVDGVSNFVSSYAKLRDEAVAKVPKEVNYSPKTERYGATFEEFITANYNGALEIKHNKTYQPYNFFNRVKEDQIKPIIVDGKVVKYDLSKLSEVDKIRLWTEYNRWSAFGRFK